ncbi:hypothetical protein VPNG_00173 [Cytospora leucostoma]|uniref:Uncharacterized protein n=1 Tax=Cytospora leucostoma TaxID=1230097 RepID=A0A423XNE3_9PEZI|nr:hypothetical protein VPNG_00173 [Cytospora leucostoma]
MHDLETEEIARQSSPGSLRGSRSLSLDSLQQLPSEPGTWDDNPPDHCHLHQPSPKFWDPVWLRIPTLITYAFCLIVVALTALAVHLFSLNNDGLVSVSGGMSEVYVWKYLPTTVVVLLLSWWNGVDYTVRLYQPWVFLKSGPRTGDLTLYLDLITPLLPSIMWKSLKIRAWMPAISLTCSLLLSIVRVLATGLLAIESTALSNSGFVLTRAGAFDGSSWKSGAQTSIAANVYVGVSSENLTSPTWVLSNATFEPFEQRNSTDGSSVSSISGATMGLFPEMRCELGSLQDDSVIMSDETYQATMEFTSKSCRVSTQLHLIDSTQIYEWKERQRWPNRSYVGTFQEVTCADGTQQYLATVTLVDSSLSLSNYSAAFCTPTYFTQNVSVSLIYPEQRLSLNWGGVNDDSSTELEGLTAMDLLKSVLNSSEAVNLGTVQQPTNTSVNNEPFLRIAALPLSNSTMGTPYLAIFLDADLMATQIRQAYSGIAALLVHGTMLDRRSEPLFGSFDLTRDRVRVKPATAITIAVILLLCALMCIIILVKRPKDVVPRDPRSVAGVALLMLASRGWLESLFDSGFEDAAAMSREQKFLSHVILEGTSRRFAIERVDSVHDDEPESSALQTPRLRRGKRVWWCPMTLKIWVRMLAIVLPVAIIGVLEDVQRLSDREGGIMTITDSNTAHYVSTMIPALSMWGLAELYSSINFNTILLSPYCSLSKGHAHASRTILSHNLGRLTLVSLFTSFKQRHVSAVFTGLAAVAGSFLTILVSGLYSTSTDSATTDILMTRLDTFNTSWSSSGPYEDGGAGQLLSLIIWQNLSYPAWTYDDLAIPQLSLIPNNNNAVSAAAAAGQTFQVSVPARRAILSCDANGPSNVTVQLDPNTSEIYTNITRTCPGSTGTPFTISIMPKRDLVGFAGQMSQLVETQTTATAWFQVSSTAPAENDAGCQSLVFFLGSFPYSMPSSKKNVSASVAQVTTLACTQLIEELSVTMHLRADLTIDTSRPPSPDETTAHLVNDGLGDDISNVQEYLVSFPIGSFFQPITDDTAVLAALNSSAAAGNLDSFFQAVALEAGFFDTGSLIGEDNVQALVNATSKMYGRYMAQVQSLTMRTSLNASSGSQSQQVPATSTYTRTGLYQSRTVKLALQIILGVMALCGIAAWFAISDARKLLPHDPGSVAGVAALVAGRDLWSGERAALVPAAPEWMSDEDVQTSGLWHRTRFVML